MCHLIQNTNQSYYCEGAKVEQMNRCDTLADCFMCFTVLTKMHIHQSCFTNSNSEENRTCITKYRVEQSSAYEFRVSFFIGLELKSL